MFQFFMYNIQYSCTLEYDRCQVNWLSKLTLSRTTDQNDRNIKSMMDHNSEQMHGPVANGY